MLVAGIFAQTNIHEGKNHLGVGFSYQKGRILPTTDFVMGDNSTMMPMKKFQSVTLKLLWQNPGYTTWQRVYNIPYYGLGFSYSDFANPVEVGNPVSVFGVFGVPVVSNSKLRIYSEFQFGIAGNWRHYDSVTNSKNLAIGGNLTVHLNIGFNAYYKISNRFEAGCGINFVHFSNGGFERPNRGFNIATPSVELKYRFQKQPEHYQVKKQQIPAHNELEIMLGYGNHQLVEFELDSNYFAVGGLSFIYSSKLTNAFRLGYGVDLNYWWGLNAGHDGNIGPRTLDNFTLGLIVQPEMVIDRLRIIGGIGIYNLHSQYGNFRQIYQRLGINIEIYKNWSLGINVRAINFILAEFLEFNTSYRIKWYR